MVKTHPKVQAFILLLACTAFQCARGTPAVKAAHDSDFQDGLLEALISQQRRTLEADNQQSSDVLAKRAILDALTTLHDQGDTSSQLRRALAEVLPHSLNSGTYPTHSARRQLPAVVPKVPGYGSHDVPRRLIEQQFGPGTNSICPPNTRLVVASTVEHAPVYGSSRGLLAVAAPTYGVRRSALDLGLPEGYFCMPNEMPIPHRSLGAYGDSSYIPRSTRALETSQASPVVKPRAMTMSKATKPSLSLELEAGVLPVGQCFCRFDYDWNEWSLVEPACKEALYERAKDPLSGLAKVWLDEYYAYQPDSGSGVLSPPHADELAAFLYSDCVPAPPCSCHALSPDAVLAGDDHAQACFNEIRIFASDKARGVPDSVVFAAVSQSSNDAANITEWLESHFSLDLCNQYQGEPYLFAQLPHAHRSKLKNAKALWARLQEYAGHDLLNWAVMSMTGLAVLATLGALIWRSQAGTAACTHALGYTTVPSATV
mmetsp:Transcript_40214/g.89240  ORF Transcript_40214/g.89240 Transcript_40214/m.89240 type:complete len:486 (+) Transcript_40214:247-1704(+)|eukprot:CAMPEP_0202904450 /NCGR_PEP_ID=MMETSP1392-20130828/29412_1 /ASSEMBLY_ACC=CAM_ASM_000868 /TAXON_ID=225041 /ORGANISM="Chlamydomonas chlamydogama, Strain SAG 11-48b" /LENGTH=485 /DNA_ID=CAMNT_0049592063 /DNA_START=220 /DNA_END=1677 /DNA_ORIENTATION=+